MAIMIQIGFLTFLLLGLFSQARCSSLPHNLKSKRDFAETQLNGEDDVPALKLLEQAHTPPNELHHLLPEEDLHFYFGTNIRADVPEYVIVSPHDATGSRRKRSVTPDEDVQEYTIDAFGEEYHLVLQHNKHLVAPGCVVQRMSNSTTTQNMSSCISKSSPEDKDCFYTGFSLNHNGSTVALSTCKGLHGIISSPHDSHDLVVKPIKGKHHNRARRSTDVRNPHIVYRREATKRLCESVDDDLELALYDLPEGYVTFGNHRVTKRSTGQFYIETALFADRTLHEAHGSDLKNYVLTVANVAAARLKDTSLGRPIQLTVVKVVILEQAQQGLEVVEEARYTLNSFCLWQERNNPSDDSNPGHHDGASLFTRLDLSHGSSGHSTAGLATTGGMCGVRTRCNIVEDTGVDMGLTLAHEIGHSLGIRHDGDHNNCPDHKNIMSSNGATGPDSFKWSSCSREALNTFLSSSRASCLHDQPQHVEQLPKDLPGVLYDRDDQCALWLGKGHNFVEDGLSGDAICAQLRCAPDSNPTAFKKGAMPLMDGSMCGDRKYCISGKCVDIRANGPRPVDGGWGAWPTKWSECSRTCGGGVMTKTRECNNPKPRLGGRACVGESTKSQLCNVKPCDVPESKYKEDQCAATDNQPLGSRTYHWIPFTIKDERECHLMCQPQNQPNLGLYRRVLDGSRDFKDGTQCIGQDSSDFHRCVRGTCQTIGCDGHSDSNYKFDRCGICGGQGTHCQPKTGTSTQGQARQWSTVAKLPKGSTGISLKNKNKYAKMTVTVGGKPLFNDNPSMTAASNTYTGDGVVVKYRKAVGSLEEQLEVVGPLQVDIEAQVFTLFDDPRFQPDISYEYNVPVSDDAAHVWETKNGACSQSCGGGHYEVEISCKRKRDNTVVQDRFCNIFHKPDSTGAACNTQPCGPGWQASDWSACSKACGGGTQTRTIKCMQRSGGQLSEVSQGSCPAHRKPATTQTCNIGACGAEWKAMAWSECSMTCGRGVQTRQVKCMSGNTEVAVSNCAGTKPEMRQTCVKTVCDTGIVGSACKDEETNCGDYDITMCSEYGSWAKSKCALTCSFCSKTSTGSASDSSSCVDVSNDCSGYGTSICEGEYKQWAEQNCAKFCGKCGSGSASSGAVSSSSSSTCVDSNSDCPGYGNSVCTGEYAEWAKTNCAKMCGHCSATSASSSSAAAASSSSSSSSSVSSSATCVDVSADCSAYGQSVCSNTDYTDWVKTNCAKFCGLCGTSSSGALTSSCQDINQQCAAYGKTICTSADYGPWAKQNCAKYCDFCGGSTCTDNSDCSGYGNNVCTDYPDWSKQNCPNKCGQCSGRRRRRSLRPAPSSCDHVITESEGTIDVFGRLESDTCGQMLVAPLGHVFTIHIEELQVICKEGDSLRLVDMTSGAPMSLCTGSNVTAWTSASNNVAILLVVTDMSRGYRLRYKTQPADLPVTACSYQLTNPSGQVASPDYPGSYPGDKLCETVITAPLDYKVLVTFITLEVEDSEGCTKDSLQLLDVGTGKTVSYCGSQKDLMWESSSNMVKLTFASDGQHSDVGFLATYRFVAP